MDWAVIFDWDGVVVDSREAHRISWEQLAAEIGQPLPEDHMERGFGRKNAWIIPELNRWTRDPDAIARLSARKEALYRVLLEAGHARLLPGTRRLLRCLASLRIPCCVGSSTERANVEQAIRQFQLEGLFRDIAASEDVEAGKPAPDVFLAAADKLSMPPQRCVVIEDSPYGIEAAHAAGMPAIGLLTTHSAEIMEAADLLVPNLEALDIPSIQNLLDHPPAHRMAPDSST